MTNLENWLRKSGNDIPVTYYGYADPGTLTSEPKWFIRRLNSSGTEIIYEYADNDYSFNKVWDNKDKYFITPSNLLIVETAITYSYIYVKWTNVPGVTRYYVTVTDPDGVPHKIYNNFTVRDTMITVYDLFNATNYTFSITAWNMAGTINLTTVISTF
jgi:hypothetical protein